MGALVSENELTLKITEVLKTLGFRGRTHRECEFAKACGKRRWTKPLAGYQPPEYTADVVYQNEGKWSDPKDVQAVKRTFLTRTFHGEVAVPRDARGRPLNPLGRTGLEGRGLLGRWGRNQAGDPLLTRVHPETGRLQQLVIERRDSGQKALPGGMVDDGEEIGATVARELFEETGTKLSFEGAATVFTGVVDDPRNTDNAWLETTVLHKHLTAAEYGAMRLQTGDDARAGKGGEESAIQPLLDHGQGDAFGPSHPRRSCAGRRVEDVDLVRSVRGSQNNLPSSGVSSRQV